MLVSRIKNLIIVCMFAIVSILLFGSSALLVRSSFEVLGRGEHRVVATAIFTLDLEPPYEWIRVVSNTVIITVCG